VKFPEAIWERAAAPAEKVATLVAAGFERRLSTLLAARGIGDARGAREFLHPSLGQLHPPELLLGLDRALERIVAARERGERIAVVGDYDADGVTATALLTATLRSVGLAVEPLLPRRDGEGYGFQAIHARRAVELGCALAITVDCGITGFDGARESARLGLDLIVTDHHLPEEELPEGAVVVNPKQPGCAYPYPELTGSGLALKLAVALLERLGEEIPWEALLRVAAIGTIADVAPLTGENRVIAALGLAALGRPRSPGLRALADRAGVRPPLRAADVGFRLGPRLNAAGRMGAADDALDLLLAREEGRARELAERLERANAERQAWEARILAEAREAAGAEGTPAPLVAAWSADWHRGVVGIVAGRLARELHRPVILLAVDGGLAVGSGRSVEGISLHDFLRPWADRFEKFGGHELAVGLTVVADRLPELRAEWQEAAATWPVDALVPRRCYDLELGVDEIEEGLWQTLRQLEPFGAGNAEPLLRLGPLATASPPRTFGAGHLSIWVKSERREIELIGWGWAARRVEWRAPFEVLAHLDRDRRSDRITLRLVDARASRRAAAD